MTSLVVASLFATAPILAQSGAKDGEWRHWGADGGTTHYSPLDQINRDNVTDLQIAWRCKYPPAKPGALAVSRSKRHDVTADDLTTCHLLPAPRSARIPLPPRSAEAAWVKCIARATPSSTGTWC